MMVVRVWTLPRFHRAMTRQYNLIDLSRRSTTYESRLIKYSGRGFDVAVPGLDRNSVDPNIFSQHPSKLQGLSRLIRMESFLKEKAPLFTHENRGRCPYNRDPFISIPRNVEYQEEMHIPVSDYSSVFLPWGPHWNAEKVERLLNNKTNSMRYASDLFEDRCFYSAKIEEIIYARYAQSDDSDDSDHVSEIGAKLSRRLKWLTVDPGRQYIGSFFPVGSENWDKGVYMSGREENSKIMAPANTKPRCRYGTKCYRKNPQHLAEYSHST